MPLKEIKEYISHQSPAAIEELLEAQQIKVAAELEQLRRIQTVINTKLSLLHRARDLQDVTDLSPVFLESQEEDQLLILSAPIFSDDHDRIFSALCEHIAQCSRYRLNSGYPLRGYASPVRTPGPGLGNLRIFLYRDLPASGKDPFFYKNPRKKAGTYAAVYLREITTNQKKPSGSFWPIWRNIVLPRESLYIRKQSWTSFPQKKRNILPGYQ